MKLLKHWRLDSMWEEKDNEKKQKKLKKQFYFKVQM